jgi:hypothetical protein
MRTPGPCADDGTMNVPIVIHPVREHPHRETEFEYLKREALNKDFERRLQRREARRARVSSLLHRHAA